MSILKTYVHTVCMCIYICWPSNHRWHFKIFYEQVRNDQSKASRHITGNGSITTAQRGDLLFTDKRLCYFKRLHWNKKNEPNLNSIIPYRGSTRGTFVFQYDLKTFTFEKNIKKKPNSFGADKMAKGHRMSCV